MKCQNCGSEFEPHTYNQKYCSYQCMLTARDTRKRERRQAERAEREAAKAAADWQSKITPTVTQ